jgi:hypothetical protein
MDSKAVILAVVAAVVIDLARRFSRRAGIPLGAWCAHHMIMWASRRLPEGSAEDMYRAIWSAEIEGTREHPLRVLRFAIGVVLTVRPLACDLDDLERDDVQTDPLDIRTSSTTKETAERIVASLVAATASVRPPVSWGAWKDELPTDKAWSRRTKRAKGKLCSLTASVESWRVANDERHAKFALDLATAGRFSRLGKDDQAFVLGTLANRHPTGGPRQRRFTKKQKQRRRRRFDAFARQCGLPKSSRSGSLFLAVGRTARRRGPIAAGQHFVAARNESIAWREREQEATRRFILNSLHYKRSLTKKELEVVMPTFIDLVENQPGISVREARKGLRSNATVAKQIAQRARTLGLVVYEQGHYYARRRP